MATFSSERRDGCGVYVKGYDKPLEQGTATDCVFLGWGDPEACLIEIAAKVGVVCTIVQSNIYRDLLTVEVSDQYSLDGIEAVQFFNINACDFCINYPFKRKLIRIAGFLVNFNIYF